MAAKVLEPGMLAAPNVRLEEKLAEGGMGSVWIASHLTLKTRVAVKFMLADLANTAEVIERFEREARAVATIKSPHVVQVLDHGVNQDGHPFIVMELLEGEDLARRIERDKSLPIALVSQIVTQAAKALGKAHQLGIVHRDLKPENLFLTDVDGDVFVKVLDFGIAKRTEEKSKRMTATGSMLGTPVFMSPEQMTNAKAVGPASDQWALGVVVYYALTGVLPFDGETMAALAIAVDRGVYVPASERNAGLPPAIDTWMKRALEKNPEDRFGSLKEMADGLARIAEGFAADPISSLEQKTLARASSAPDRGDTRTMRGTSIESSASTSPRVIGLVVVAVALVAAAVVGFSYVKAPEPSTASASARSTSDAARPPPPRPRSTAPIVEPAAIDPLHAPSATASASGGPSPSASAEPTEPSARASSTPAASGGRPAPHPAPRPSSNGEIPTTF